MRIQSNITTTKHLNRALIAALIVTLFILPAATALAHGGFDHVMGTVVQVANNVLTVKTAKGNVDVKVDDKTELTKNGQKAQVSDLTPGARVVVDIPEGSNDKLAHSVKIGTATKAAAH
jgi:hypothetical protein